jgi:RHS repeat-associated protein
VSGSPLAGYVYTLGAAGNRLSVQELSGRTVQYAYDDLYRLTSETIAGATAQNGTVTYQYDAVGNRKQLTSTVAAIPATGLLNYDANDRISTQLYDNNGNTVNNGTQNVYDFENRLVRRGNVTIVYDGDGNRVSETVAGATVSYLVAEVNPTGYPQVVQERQNQFGPILKNYEWGLQLIAEGDLSPSPLHYYGMDGHGSVRFLTDTTGKITDTYDYDAFGNLIAQTGTTANNYLFAGEQFDPALGVYYNRARYFDQRLGRFWTADDYEGRVGDPLSLHRYLYASANAVNRIDPSGNFDIGETLTVAAIATSINTTEQIIGQAIIDQVKFGGNAGLKSLFIGLAITLLAPVAITVIGKGIVRLAPALVKLAGPARVIINKLSSEEALFAEEVVAARGGTFTGQVVKDTPGIDGFLGEIPASLKVQITGSARNVRSVIQDARGQLTEAGYVDAEIFVSAKNVSAQDILSGDNGGILADIAAVAKSGAVKAVNILTKDGWLHIQ